MRFEIPEQYKPRFKLRPGQVLRRCKGSTDTLLELCIAVVDKFPLPLCLSWSVGNVAFWIAKDVGFPRYANAFFMNKIGGHRLVFLDASVLSHIGIHDFEHIKIITKKVRELIGIEKEYFARSISLPCAYPETCYKMFRARTGPITNSTKRSKFWRDNHIIRPSDIVLHHWNIACTPDLYAPHDVFGYMPRYQLYKVKRAPPDHVSSEMKIVQPVQDEWDIKFDKIVEVVHRPRRFHITITSIKELQEQGSIEKELAQQELGSTREEEVTANDVECKIKKRICRGPCKGLMPKCLDEY